MELRNNLSLPELLDLLEGYAILSFKEYCYYQAIHTGELSWLNRCHNTPDAINAVTNLKGINAETISEAWQEGVRLYWMPRGNEACTLVVPEVSGEELQSIHPQDARAAVGTYRYWIQHLQSQDSERFHFFRIDVKGDRATLSSSYRSQVIYELNWEVAIYGSPPPPQREDSLVVKCPEHLQKVRDYAQSIGKTAHLEEQLQNLVNQGGNWEYYELSLTQSMTPYSFGWSERWRKNQSDPWINGCNGGLVFHDYDKENLHWSYHS